MRYVEPLSPEAWKIFMEHLERGPTKKQIEIMEKIKKMKFNEVDDDEEDDDE